MESSVKPAVRQYTLEYKQEAIQLVLSGVKALEVARRLESPSQNIGSVLKVFMYCGGELFCGNTRKKSRARASP